MQESHTYIFPLALPISVKFKMQVHKCSLMTAQAVIITYFNQLIGMLSSVNRYSDFLLTRRSILFSDVFF